MGIDNYLPDKKSTAYSVFSFLLGIWAKDRISGYVNKTIDGIAEKAGKTFARKMSEHQNLGNTISNPSIQQPQAYVQKNLDPTQQFYQAVLEQNKTLTEALLEQTEAIKKLPNKLGYRVEKSVKKAMKKNK